jgi:hypothetical protein
MEKMREQFEAWECDSDQGLQTDPVWLMYDAKTNTYPLDKIQDRWKVWQASRAAQAVEWPDRHDYTNPDVAGAAILDCRTAFGKTVKVKP